jgi:hypothetical protein
MSGRLKSVFAIGAIAVFVSCVLFLACVDSPSSAQVMAFVFLLIAEIVATFALCVVEGELLGPASRVFRIGSYSATGVYLFISFVVSSYYILLSPEKVGLLVGLQVAALGALAAIEIVLWVAGRSGFKRDSMARARSEAVSDLGARLRSIQDRLPESPERAKLARLIDEVRYFNWNADVDEDADISEKIDELDQTVPATLDGPPAACGRIIDELMVLAKRRGEASARAKRGGF